MEYFLYIIFRFFYFKKLYILGLRDSIKVINFLVIFFFSLFGCAMYYFCSRSFF